MSAIAIAMGTDGIIAACDGVCYDYETGTVSGFVSKVILLPEYGAFIGWTGAGAFGPALRWEINQAIVSFDDLVEQFGHLCEAVQWKLFGYNEGPETEVSCVIAGWSQARQSYEVYRLVSYDKTSIDLSDGRKIRIEPFKAYPLPEAWWCSISPTRRADFGLSPPAPGEEAVDTAIRLICAARADSGRKEHEDGHGRFFMAGGFVQVVVLQQNSTQSYIAHRWPEDVLGQPIDPSKGSPLPAWLEMHNAPAAAA